MSGVTAATERMFARMNRKNSSTNKLHPVNTESQMLVSTHAPRDPSKVKKTPKTNHRKYRCDTLKLYLPKKNCSNQINWKKAEEKFESLKERYSIDMSKESVLYKEQKEKPEMMVNML